MFSILSPSIRRPQHTQQKHHIYVCAACSSRNVPCFPISPSSHRRPSVLHAASPPGFLRLLCYSFDRALPSFAWRAVRRQTAVAGWRRFSFIQQISGVNCYMLALGDQVVNKTDTVPAFTELGIIEGTSELESSMSTMKERNRVLTECTVRVRRHSAAHYWADGRRGGIRRGNQGIPASLGSLLPSQVCSSLTHEMSWVYRLLEPVRLPSPSPSSVGLGDSGDFAYTQADKYSLTTWKTWVHLVWAFIL